MTEPKRIWWARPGKLCALERPGGGGRSHRPERRAAEIEYLKEKGVHTVISTMPTRHNLAAYEEAGLIALHMPVEPGDEQEALNDITVRLRRETRRKGAVAIHGNRHTDFAAAVCASHLYDHKGTPMEVALMAAESSSLGITEEAWSLTFPEYATHY